jgi:hypothetical protein
VSIDNGPNFLRCFSSSNQISDPDERQHSPAIWKSLKGRNFRSPWDAPPATMNCPLEHLVSFQLSVVGILAVFPEEMLIVEPAR